MHRQRPRPGSTHSMLSMLVRRIAILAAMPLWALALPACNSAGQPEPKAGASTAPPPPSPPPPAAQAAPEGPRKPSCADGSCFECGDMVCLKGFYCETARPGAAPSCASATACPQAPSCACLGPLIKGCSCDERGGVAHVKCGG
jgi:hypothetical protein